MTHQRRNLLLKKCLRRKWILRNRGQVQCSLSSLSCNQSLRQQLSFSPVTSARPDSELMRSKAKRHCLQFFPCLKLLFPSSSLAQSTNCLCSQMFSFLEKENFGQIRDSYLIIDALLFLITRKNQKLPIFPRCPPRNVSRARLKSLGSQVGALTTQIRSLLHSMTSLGLLTAPGSIAKVRKVFLCGRFMFLMVWRCYLQQKRTCTYQYKSLKCVCTGSSGESCCHWYPF